MAKYRNPTTGLVEEIGNPDLNPSLIAGKELVSDTTPLGVISSENLSQTSSPDFKQPEQTPTPSPAIIPDTAYAPTQQETDISKMIKDLTSTSGLEGERLAYTAELEKAQGLDALKKAEEDYGYQMKQLEQEYKAIVPQVEGEMRGRASIGAISGEAGARQREIAVQSLTVSGLLLAAQGRVASAQNAIDRAVNAKFAQREADRKAKIENLDLLLKDPSLTLAQQKRADAKKIALAKEEEADKKKKEDSATAMKWATELANNPLVANQIANIAMSDNPDLQKAFALYSANRPVDVGAQLDLQEKQLKIQKLKQEISQVGNGEELLSIADAKALGVPYGTTKAQAIAMNKIPGAEIPPGVSPYQEERQTRILDSVKDLKDRVSGLTVGILGLGKLAPGSFQRDFANDLQTLKSNIAFGELTAMREASKTGGALGQVSNIELGLLESALAGLDQLQSPSNFRKNLERIEGSITRWQNAVKKEDEEQQLRNLGYTPEQIQQIKNSK